MDIDTSWAMNVPRSSLLEIANAMGSRAKRQFKRNYRSRFNGPLPGCPITEKHASGKCVKCHAVRMKNFRKTGKTING